MKDDYTTSSHYLTHTFLFRKVERMYFFNLGLKGLKPSSITWRGYISRVDLQLFIFLFMRFIHPHGHGNFFALVPFPTRSERNKLLRGRGTKPTLRAVSRDASTTSSQCPRQCVADQAMDQVSI